MSILSPIFVRKMAKNNGKILCLLTGSIIVCLAVNSCHFAISAEKTVPLTSSDPFYQELIVYMEQLKKGIENRDASSITQMALPEYRQSVEAHLQDTTSELYSLLLGEENSARSFLQSAKSINVNLFRHLGYEEYGSGTTACFYDKGAALPDFSDENITEGLHKSENTLCFFLFKADEKWYVNFEFGGCCE